MESAGSDGDFVNRTDAVTQSTNIIQYTSVQVIFYILYGMIFVLGIFGNVLVCYIVYTNKAMQTVTNLFIMNLAVSDILLCVLAVPFTPLYSFIGKWIFGRAICHLVPYAQGTSVYVSTLTLTAIAIDRYFVIIHPLRQRMKLITCVRIIQGVWLFSMIITLPYGICMSMRPYEKRYVCEENWPMEKSEEIFGCFTLIMQFVIPFVVIAYCYVCISLRLNRRARSKPGTKNARKEEADRERKKRTNRMLIAMVTIFGVCWLPLNVINVANDFYDSGGSWEYFHLFFFLTHSMAMSSTCYNPFLYAWLNENFRKEFKQVLPCASRTVKTRFCNGNNEHTEDTLLHSCNSSTRHLEPREPIAERIPATGAGGQDHHDNAAAAAAAGLRLSVIKEESSQRTVLPEYEHQQEEHAM